MQYCAQRGIEFTRSRPYRKNDQAWIEQMNGSVVRRFTGHERYSGRIAGQTMVHLYQAVRLYVNYFQPSFKLLEKMRDGAKTIKRYSPPATPCDRLLQYDTIAARTKEEPSDVPGGPGGAVARHPRGPVGMATISSPELAVKVDRFLARLACGNRGKPGPRIGRVCAHLATGAPRKDPFESVWCDVLLWLEKDPDTNAEDLPRLRKAHPDRFGDAQLRRTWRGSWPRNWSTLLLEPLRIGLARNQRIEFR